MLLRGCHLCSCSVNYVLVCVLIVIAIVTESQWPFSSIFQNGLIYQQEEGMSTWQNATGSSRSSGGSWRGSSLLRSGELGELEKNTYADTRPLLPCFTRHDEFFKDCRNRVTTTEAVTWQLGLRSQTPAFTKRPRTGAQEGQAATPREHGVRALVPGATSAMPRSTPRRDWNPRFHHLREHTFDMLQDHYNGSLSQRTVKKQFSITQDTEKPDPARPRIVLDSHASKRQYWDEPYSGKVGPNLEAYRSHLQAGVHPDACRRMLSMRE
eukprot:TRINITY_DN11343_c0_g1_i1.p1 TRINITY_DN11343_c0_g1~~TRINITY_DN11343_c0_g1_i1.p1  ORF type:complete len:277 (-),score=9.69 TRINITY_DN11343_c0_g1_i1:321-1121(-)